MSGRRYLVKVGRSYHGPDRHDEYVTSLRHDPYQRGDNRSHTTTTSQSEAFLFTKRSAAEVAAVYVGGRVVRLVKKAKPPVLFVPTPEPNKAMVRMDGLRRLCGHVEDGSDRGVTLYQDDATEGWYISFSDGGMHYYGETFESAIDNAMNGERK